MALLLVIPAVALATVLAYAVLTNTGMQEQISANAAHIAQADCLAESGVNYALYNLQNPSNAPSHAGNYWPGTTGAISLGGIPGTVTVTVLSLGNSQYSISSAATVPGSNSGSISRVLNVAVQATATFGIPNQAAGVNGNLVPNGAKVTVTGDLRTTGSVTLPAGSSVSGNVYATALTLSGGTDGAFVQEPSTGTTAAPSAVTDYRVYTLNGVSYSATQLTSDPVAGRVLGPTVSNPAGIYYAQNRNMNLNGVTINGTLIVKNGNLSVATGTANVITPAANFPGLVVDKQLTVPGSNKLLTVNGLAWIGTGNQRDRIEYRKCDHYQRKPADPQLHRY